MKITAMLACLLVVVTCAPAVAYDASDRAKDEAKLLDMHKKVLQYHVDNNLDAWMREESEEYTSANRGTIDHPTVAQRRARLEPYLNSTTFSEYRDLVDPIVKVANDGSIGWIICQVKVAGESTTQSGEKMPFESVWAWIELYEKQDGAWKRVGNVSNRKPPEVKPEHGE